MSAVQAPWSREAEQSVLGALLFDNAAIDRIAELRAEHFFDHANRRVFVAIASLVNAHRPADVITVFERVQANGDADEVGGLAYVNALAAGVPSAANIVRYAGIVMDRAKARMLLSAGSAAMEAAHDQSRPIDERIEQVSAELTKLLESSAPQDATKLSDLILAHTQTIEDRDAGKVRVIPTGLTDIDDMLGGGIRPGSVMIIGARPSQGKTALALTVAMNMASTHGVGFLSMEMSKEEIGDRSIALLGRINLSDVQRPPKHDPAAGEFWSRLLSASEDAAGKALYADDQGGLTIAQVRAKARALRRKHGIDVLVVDYLQLMSGTDPKQNRAYQIEEITRGLKALAKELGIAVIALAQVLRRVDAKSDGMPGLSDLKDSGSTEQDADVVMFLNRPIQANPSLPETFKFFAKAFIAKNRQGPTGLVNLTYIGHETRFANWSGPEPQGNHLADRKRAFDDGM